MPNWVYNNLKIEGNAHDIANVKAQLNKPFTHNVTPIGDLEYSTKKEIKFSNPVFAFWNIIRPSDIEAYHKQPDHTLPLAEAMLHKGDSWYDFNNREWGVKWDVAVSDDAKYPETELYDETNISLSYRFNTPWGVPDKALIKLTEQYPNLKFTLSFEEETGWGGEWVFENGEYFTVEEYGWKCRECDHTEDETPWCDDCEFDICPSCGYNESSEPCDTHKENVDV